MWHRTRSIARRSLVLERLGHHVAAPAAAQRRSKSAREFGGITRERIAHRTDLSNEPFNSCCLDIFPVLSLRARLAVLVAHVEH